jgi:serine/threonine protein kinase
MLEVCPHESLHEMLTRRTRLEEIEVQCLAKQIIAVLLFLRSKRIIHRDLKLGNILLGQNMEVKLCDFGLAV